MFRRGSLFLRILLALIVVGILIGAGAILYRAGYNQGYLVGAAAGDKALDFDRNFPFWLGYHPFMHSHTFTPFVSLPVLFCGGIFLLLLIGALFLPRPWHYHTRPWGPPPWMKDHPAGWPESQGQAVDQDKPQSDP
jgi:hypothetical protein